MTIVFLIIGLFILTMVAGIPINNIKLFVIRNQFEKLNSQNIAQSRLLAKRSVVGHEGASNLCDFYTGQFRASPLLKADIEIAYENLTISSFWGDENSPLKLEILFTDDEWFIDNLYSWYQWLRDNSNKFDIRPGENTYVVYAISLSHPPGWDLRCH